MLICTDCIKPILHTKSIPFGIYTIILAKSHYKQKITDCAEQIPDTTYITYGFNVFQMLFDNKSKFAFVVKANSSYVS